MEEKEKASIAATLPFLSAAAAAKISGNREEEPSAHQHHQKHPKLISRRRRPFPSLFLSPQTNRPPLRPRRKFNTCSKSNFALSLTLACLARSTWWETLRELSFNIGRFFCPLLPLSSRNIGTTRNSFSPFFIPLFPHRESRLHKEQQKREREATLLLFFGVCECVCVCVLGAPEQTCGIAYIFRHVRIAKVPLGVV